jgi:hypothetical protein
MVSNTDAIKQIDMKINMSLLLVRHSPMRHKK